MHASDEIVKLGEMQLISLLHKHRGWLLVSEEIEVPMVWIIS